MVIGTGLITSEFAVADQRVVVYLARGLDHGTSEHRQ